MQTWPVFAETVTYITIYRNKQYIDIFIRRIVLYCSNEYAIYRYIVILLYPYNTSIYRCINTQFVVSTCTLKHYVLQYINASQYCSISSVSVCACVVGDYNFQISSDICQTICNNDQLKINELTLTHQLQFLPCIYTLLIITNITREL